MHTATELIEITIAQQQRKQVQLIASYLMQALCIPDGDHLVRFFGTGQEPNNRQALIQWIEMHLDEIDPDEAEQRLKQLASNIVNTSGQEQICNE